MKLIDEIKMGYAEGKAQRTKSKFRVKYEAKVVNYAQVKAGEYAMKKVMSDPGAEEKLNALLDMI